MPVTVLGTGGQRAGDKKTWLMYMKSRRCLGVSIHPRHV